MSILRTSPCINIVSVIATTYFLTWYFLTPSPNQCQMTFMMEPPKFIPIEVDDAPRDEYLTYPEMRPGGPACKTELPYKLFMYSEFGFPMASNVRRDLKDSMPVLFVPGNAGSYQQVRSIASTCIRRQLQSLDAFKFIFYTIDFGGEFSGISGELIEQQTRFVQNSLDQITRMHPSDTEGVILIGHSVGGFISKFLFTRPNFQPNSVPLLISLASPLTKPYLVLDNKMGELYRKTDHYWNDTRRDDRSTVAISISGGGSDRLVPMHLSLDPSFDLSLTTESMKDVFLSTDHVCVTWCRELMHKLANLLSALMDRKMTRLIPDKNNKLSIVSRELLLKRRPEDSELSIKGDWSSKKPTNVSALNALYSIHRNQLKDKIIIADGTRGHNLLIMIDHIDPLKPSSLFGCEGIDLNSDSERITCYNRSDLMSLATTIPTNRYEPRRTIIKLSSQLTELINHIGLDFTSRAHKTGLPESVSIQPMTKPRSSKLHIPSLLESLVRKVLLKPVKYQIIPNLNLTTELQELELISSGLIAPALSIKLITSRCRSEGKPNTATILYYRGGYMSTSAYSSTRTKNFPSTEVELTLRESILIRGMQSQEVESHLDVYFDGTCENALELELDMFDLVAQMMKKDLGSILTCITFILSESIISQVTSIMEPTCNPFRYKVPFIGPILIIMMSRMSRGDLSFQITSNLSWLLDDLTLMILIHIVAEGLLSFLVYFTRRLIDLATILNRAQLILVHRVKVTFRSPRSEQASTKMKNGVNGKKQTISELSKTDIDWPLIGLAIASSAILSSAPITILALFMLIKASLGISMNQSQDKAAEEQNKHCHETATKAHLNKQAGLRNDLIVNLAVMSSLVVIVNIPDLLLKLTNRGTFINLAAGSSNLGVDYVATSLSLILKKLICDRIEVGPAQGQDQGEPIWAKNRILMKKLFNFASSKYLSFCAIVPIMLIESNVRLILVTELLLSLWLLNFLNSRQMKQKSSLQ